MADDSRPQDEEALTALSTAVEEAAELCDELYSIRDALERLEAISGDVHEIANTLHDALFVARKKLAKARTHQQEPLP